MIRVLLVVFMLITVAASTTRAAEVAGISLDETLSVDDMELSLNGAGVRKKLFFKLYVGSLYVDASLQGAEAEAIVQADTPMLIQLNILSDLLTRDKMIKALTDGFENATGGNTEPLQEQISTMIDSLSQPITPGDVYQLMYVPQSGTRIVVGDELMATIEGLPFKQALFGIWLSESPAQASLKQAMLSR